MTLIEQELATYLERINNIMFEDSFDNELTKDDLKTKIFEVLEEWCINEGDNND